MLKKFNYVDREGMHIKKVYCKVCGAILVDTIVVEEKQEKRGDKEFIVQTTALRPTTKYDELCIKFKDGSRHITPICKECKKQENLDLIGIYKADIKEALKEGFSLPFRKI